mgnify:CR=1 FL=1
MTAFADSLLDLLYPPKCAFCRKPVRGKRMICPTCERDLPMADPEAQRRVIPNLAVCISPLYYTGDVRMSLHRYKFQGAAAYYRIYAELMAECLTEQKLEPDLVTWVPLSRKRLRSRGYDQAKLLAAEVARRCGLPCEKTLEKIRNNPAQSGTANAEERQKNVQGVYRAVTSFAGEHVLLVDDIVTTGSTLSEAAAVLIHAGADPVSGLTLARTIPNHSPFRTELNGDFVYADF